MTTAKHSADITHPVLDEHTPECTQKPGKYGVKGSSVLDLYHNTFLLIWDSTWRTQGYFLEGDKILGVNTLSRCTGYRIHHKNVNLYSRLIFV